MKLKKLEIHGFKSFADKTVIHFDNGITIVVGPNGCGKSNIVDSLRWCMGEQSAKHLRGEGMQDVIFNGSDARGPSGMAEVALTFSNDDGDISGEWSAYPEITIARRLYRNGDSEYLINKQVARLKDVQDLVLGTGVGTKGYSIIEQGRIGMIVSSKPEDRRRLIEEAAGITKYKARRQAAERKMDATRQNLVRVNDLVVELAKRLGTLRRQAAKAEKFRALRAELRELELHDASMEFLGLTAGAKVDRDQISAMEEGTTGQQARLAVMEADAELARLQLLDDEKRLQELQGLLYQADQEIRLLEQNAAHHDQTASGLLKRAADDETEAAAQRGRLTVVAEESERLARDLEALQAETDQSEETTSQANAELEELKATRDELAAGVEEARQTVQNSRAEETAAQTHLAQLGRRTAELGEREARARAEQDNLDAEAEAVTNSKRLGNASVASRREEKAELEAQRQRIAEELGVSGEKLRLALLQVNGAQEDLGKKRQRLHGLEEIHGSLTRAPEGVRAVMEWHRDNKVEGIVGLLADAVEAPARLEAAVAAALGAHLDDVVVENVDVAVEVARRLSREQKGRATLLPRTPRKAHPQRTAQDFEGVVGWLVDELKVDEKLKDAVESRLGDVLVVKELKAAREMAQAGFAGRLVTLGGELLDEVGAVIGGSADEGAQTFLRQKREITELAHDVEEMAAKLHALDDARAALHFQVEDLKVKERDVNEESQTVALRLVEAEKDLHRLADQESRLMARRDALLSEMTRITELLTELRMEERQHTETLERARASIQEQERGMQVTSERLAVMQAQFTMAQERATELRVRAQSAKDRREQLERSIQSNGRIKTDTEELLARLKKQAEDSRLESARLTGEARVEREKALVRAGEGAQLRASLEGDRAAYDEAQRKVAALESEARIMRNQVAAMQGNLGETKVALKEKEMALQHLQARIRELYQVALVDVVVDFHLLPLPDETKAERGVDLRRQIEGMGEINLTAIDECKDVEERHTFLANQQDDLTHALNQLEKAITKINKTTRRRFQEAFEAINQKFMDVFPRLFRGGKAWLQLTNPEDMLETGIEIFAQPPGKKVQSVQLLSGGEKALTAVSLVFSIFLIKPSPFCLLDEVDAPLDEANVARFNELVRDVSSVSQFIIITHNKRTMEIADNLYGITMEEPGISKLVNVRVNVAEVTAQAARNQLQAAPVTP